MRKKEPEREHAPAEEKDRRSRHRSGQDGPVPNVLSHVQKAVGNQALANLAEAGIVKPKLRVSQSRDSDEIEADRLAERVVQGQPATPASRTAAESIQRDDATADRLHDAFPLVEKALHSSGQPLDEATRADMEPRFGHDFSRVRVHTDAESAESAKSLGAQAFTLGHHLYFDRGSYVPASLEGRRLLAHELAHVVQARSATGNETLHRAPPGGEPDWKVPTDGVVQAWMYNQIDNWHTGATQALGNFKDTVKEETSVGFWLGLAGNVTWALGSFGAPPVAVTVGLIGVAMGTIGSLVQSHADKAEADRVDAIYQDFLKGFNDSRSKMDKEVIPRSNTIMASDDFKKAVASKSTEAWQDVVKKQANMPEGTDLNQVSKNTERNLYNLYLKNRGAWYSRDIFHVESPHHPGFESEEKNLWLHNVPSKVRDRLTAIGVDWKYIFELPIPHRDRDLYRKSGTVGAIEYWDYEEATLYPPSWTKADIEEFLKKVPSYVAKEQRAPRTRVPQGGAHATIFHQGC